MSNDNQQKLIDLQAQLAFQEDTIQALNDELVQQGKLILTLSRKVNILESKLDDMAHSVSPKSSNNDSEVPPHY